MEVKFFLNTKFDLSLRKVDVRDFFRNSFSDKIEPESFGIH